MLFFVLKFLHFVWLMANNFLTLKTKVMKRVLVQFNFPNMPASKYEQAWDTIRAKGFTTIPGLVFHVGVANGNDWHVTDVWESEAAFVKFGEVLGPLFQELGIPQVAPTITPVHYLYVGETASVLQ
jgi:hypothetical protein